MIEYTNIPVVPLRGIVILPGESVTFDAGRESSIRAARAATLEPDDTRGLVLMLCQKDVRVATPAPDDLYTIGTLCRITRMVQHNSGTDYSISVDSVSRAEVVGYCSEAPFMSVSLNVSVENAFDQNKFEALRRHARELLNNLLNITDKGKLRALSQLDNILTPGTYAYAITALVINDINKRREILETADQTERLEKAIGMLSYEIDIAHIDSMIETQTRKAIDKNQREYYLHEKIKAIKTELGETDQSVIDSLRERIGKKQLPGYVLERVTSEMNRLATLPTGSHETPGIISYLELVLDLPWTEITEDNLNIINAREILDRDHYGLEKVKDRIIEYLSVARRTHGLSGQILCLVGPPGVGKTSVVRSIAEAVGRSFVRMSLGGVDDESDIRGHRRTYIGAIPGRIITAMRKSASINPLMLFDEIDKLSKSMQGDPASAMLEVLDSEQNNTFHDHYLEVPYDLSHVMFITTANSLDTIPRPLLDRMEIIEVPGYLESEKYQIALRHLIPKQLNKHGLTDAEAHFTDEAIYSIIRSYTREAGVRELERMIAAVLRKVSCGLDKTPEVTSIQITPESAAEFLGAPTNRHNDADTCSAIGRCNGLAWTEVGGEVLPIEAAVMPGTGKIETTGNLGTVMKESAMAAVTYIRSHADRFAIDSDYFSRHDLHIHALSGAVPKDGPSAGITIAATIVSALTNTPIRAKIAMTGEISIRGDVLPIGGLREKLLGAAREGVKTVLVPKANEDDVSRIDGKLPDELEIRYVSCVDEVLDCALEQGGLQAAGNMRVIPQNGDNSAVGV